MNTEFTAISLFSGLGGDSLGMKQAGCKVIAYNELMPTFCKSHDANFPDSSLICDGKVNDISKLKDSCFDKYSGKTDILFAGFPCFIKDTLVLTETGYKQIQNVILEDKLLTHSGKFQNIVNLQRKKYNGLLYELKLKYHPELITCTEEHPFYVRKKITNWNNSLNKYDSYYGEPEWVNASLLTMNYMFGMVINSKSIIPKFSFGKSVLYLDNNNYWFMIGYFIAHGWLEYFKKYDESKNTNVIKYKIRFSFNEDDNETIDRIKKVLNIEYKNKSDKRVIYGCSDFIWFNILKKFYKSIDNKIIPEWVQNAPKHLIQEFINGYVLTDNYVSYNLAYNLQRLYLKLGHIASVEKIMPSKPSIIENKKNGKYRVNVYINKLRSNSSFIENNYVWYSPYEIKMREVENETVYNFEVEVDNSYVVYNTIVHNCQGFSTAGKKKDDDPRNTMFLQFLRATRLTKPNMIIGENVKGLLSRKTSNNELYIDIIVSEFEKLGYEVIYQVFKCEEYNVPQKRERLIILGIKKDNPYGWTPSFPEPSKTKQNLMSIINYNMTGAVKVDPKWFEDIPASCILTDMNDKTEYKSNNGGHPYLTSQIVASDEDCYYNGKQHEYLFSFGKRDSPIHCEIIDIRKAAKTIICTYERQPRLFVPLKNPSGCYLRMLLPDELKQIQGFPPDYVVCGNNKEQIVQIGNAVPPPLIKAIVENIIN